jgi:thioredoxin 1
MRFACVSACIMALAILSGCGQAPSSSKPASGSADTVTASGDALHLTEATYQTEIQEYAGVAMLDFWASWCGPCKLIAPAIEELATELKGTAKIAKIDVDQNPNLAKEFEISSIPCLVLMKNGKEIDRKVGAISKQEMKAWIEQASK